MFLQWAHSRVCTWRLTGCHRTTQDHRQGANHSLGGPMQLDICPTLCIKCGPIRTYARLIQLGLIWTYTLVGPCRVSRYTRQYCNLCFHIATTTAIYAPWAQLAPLRCVSNSATSGGCMSGSGADATPCSGPVGRIGLEGPGALSSTR